jgi:lysophospholipase L1-like esterase
VTINRHGYRGRAYPKDKPDGVIRILGLGDSNMFGYGMADNQTFLHLLERSLNARSAGKRYQVLNFAVPGYNTMQEAEQLESVGIQYRPDMILILFVPNDAMLPNFVRRKKGSGLMPFTRVDELMNEGAALFGTEAERDQLEFWNDPSRVPPEYASMVGKGAVREGLRRISYLAGTHGFQVFLFCLIKGQPLQAEVVRWCPELGIRFLDLDEYMAENGLRHGPELWISEEDPHPNAAFHRAIADFLSQALTRP